MADRGIIFSAPMIEALLDGRKTMTRRILKWQPPPGATVSHLYSKPAGVPQVAFNIAGGAPIHVMSGRLGYQKNDRLWVREAWRALEKWDDLKPRQIISDRDKVRYEAGPPRNPLWAWGRYRHGRFMPRWASRLTLIVTDVRVQRLQDINEHDAHAEGTGYFDRHGIDHCAGGHPSYSVGAFRDLWDSLHGSGAWAKNPWVVASSFTAIALNIDLLPEAA